MPDKLVFSDADVQRLKETLTVCRASDGRLVIEDFRDIEALLARLKAVESERNSLNAVIDSWKTITDTREGLLAEIDRLKTELEYFQKKAAERKVDSINQEYDAAVLDQRLKNTIEDRDLWKQRCEKLRDALKHLAGNCECHPPWGT